MKRKIIFALFALMILTSTSAQGQSLRQDLRQLQSWQAGCVVSTEAVSHYGLSRCFLAEPISDAVFARMRGRSYPTGCTIARSSLRYVRTLYVGFDGYTHIGELVCNKLIATDLVAIIRELYQQRYPIGQMRLIDDYHASDEESMRANNTSCFCYRRYSLPPPRATPTAQPRSHIRSHAVTCYTGCSLLMVSVGEEHGAA